MSLLRKSPAFLRYGFAVLAVAVVTALKLLVPVIQDESPFLLLFIALILSAWFGGWGPGLLATGLGTLSVNYFFQSPGPGYTLGIESTGQAVRLGVFVVEGVMVTWLAATLRSARGRAEASALEVRRSAEALRGSEERYRSIFENAVEGIFLTTAEGRLLSMNPSGAEMFGYHSPQEMLEAVSNVQHLYTDTAQREELIRRLQEQGVVSGLQVCMQRKDGSEIWTSLSARAIKDGSGKVVRLEGTLEDITERKKAEEALEESEERYALVVRGSNDGIFDWNIRTGELYWNDRLYQIVGLSRSKGVPNFELFSELLYPEDRQRVLDAITAHLERGEKYDQEFRLLHSSSGEYRICHARGEAQRDENGAPVRMAGMVQDITERKRTEDALRDSEARKAAIMETALDCIITIDHAGMIMDFNPAAERTFGHCRADVLGRELAEVIIPPTYREAHRRGLAHYLATGEGPVLNRRIELSGMRSDGSEFPVEVTIVPTHIGEHPMFTGYLRDITERKEAEEALRKSEESFRLLVQGVQDYAIFMLDPEGCVTTWNMGAERSSRYRADEIIGEHFSVFYTEEDIERGHPEEELRIAVSEGRYEEEGLRVRKDGSGYWANVVITALKDEAGNLRGFSKVTRDITERKKVEEQLQRRERSLSEAQRIAHLGSWEYIIDEDVAQWSDELYRIFGFAPREFVPRYRMFFQYVHPEDRRSVQKEAIRALRGDGSSEIDYRIVRTDGEVRGVHTEYEVVRDAQGSPVKMVGIVQDITERKRAEDALHEQNEHLASLHETTLNLVERLEPNYLLQGVLERAGALIGTPHGFVYLRDPDTGELEMRAGAGLFARHTGHRIAPHQGLSGRVLESGEPVIVDDYGSWGGRLEVFSETVQAAAGVPLRLGGRVMGSLGVAHAEPGRTFGEQEMDLLTRFAALASVALDNAYLYDSARRELAARERTEKELAALVDELQRSNAELEQFAYVASHDLQEPLRMVSSYTQLLGRRYKDKLDADADEFIGYAVDGANRMQILINDLLQYSRVGTRGKELVSTDTKAVFEAACADLRRAIEDSGAEVTSGELPVVTGDDVQLRQLFQNLINNALKFRKEEASPEVRVEAERQDGHWLFSVSDNGIGIDPEYRERVFVIFQRLHGRTEYGGTGIGLAVCKKIVERHGGKIWVDSEPGEGSTFYFTLRSAG